MTDITLSSAVRSNLLSLQSTADLMSKTQERLATGLEVNSALDNPTNFFTASSLNSRAGDLGRLLDGVANATQTLEAADNGIAAITDLVESAQASARQALQAKGSETTSEVVGDTAATFDPQALTSVSGENGANTLAADAAAAIDTQSIAGDRANIPAINSGDLDAGATGGGALSAVGAPGLADGDSVRLNVNGTDYTLNFDGGTAVGAITRTGDATTGFNLTIGVDQTVADLETAFNTLLNGSGVTVDNGADNDEVNFSFGASVDTVVFSDFDTDNATEGNGAVLAKIGLDNTDAELVDYTSGGATGDLLAAKNADLRGLLDSDDGATLQVQLGNNAAQTLTFGTGAGEISSKADLINQVNNLTGVTATGSATGAGAINITTTDTNDADSSLEFTASNAAVNTALGFDVAADNGGLDLDTQNALVTTAQAQNLLTQGAVTSGNTLSITVGNSTPYSVSFGTGANQVSTLAELNQDLRDLSGGSASVDADGELNITANTAGDTITIGGDTQARTAFGVRDADVGNLFNGEANSLLDGTNITQGDKLSVQIGTNTTRTITFGTGANEVNSIEELEDELGQIAGARAEIDDETGAITITATNGTDPITITSTDSADVAKASVGASFGLTAAVTPSTTTQSTERDELQDQFNELLLQIDELAEDASFNGVNLLDSDNLKVIFNEDGSSELDINGVDFSSQGLGLSRLATDYFQTDSNINSTLELLDTTISTLRSQASEFGSNLSIVETREDFTKNMINTLETGAANLTLADTNEEGANLTALQTRQQLSTTALSLATQADQNVLRLF